MNDRSPDPPLERDAELAALAASLDAARQGRAGVLALTGPAGIGKSTLLDVAAMLAAERGLTVLRATAHELERDLPFGVVHQLLGAADIRYEGAAQLARPLLQEGRAEPADGLFPLLHGLYWAVAGLAERGPVALVVDDVQWADEPSLRWLGYLARRLDALGVALLCGVRSDTDGAPPQLAAVLELADVLRPAPLSDAAVAQLVRRRLGKSAGERFCAACRTASGGNPFLLHELLRDLEADGTAPVDAARDVVMSRRPEGVARRVRRRLERLGDGAVRFAEALAVLDSAPAGRCAALAGLGKHEAAAALDRLAGAELVTGDGDGLRIAHPLLRNGVEAGIGPGELGLLHARAAELLVAVGEPDARVATHLLRAPGEGDAGQVDLLVRAAAQASGRGAQTQAVAFLRRALEMPAATPRRPELLAAHGRAASAVNDPQAADRLLEATALAPSADMASGLAIEAVGALLAQSRAARAADVVRETLAGGELPAERRRELHALALVAEHIDPGVRPVTGITLEELLPAGERPATRAEYWALASGALGRSVAGAGPSAEVAGLALRAWDGGRLLEHEGPEGIVASYVTGVLAAADALVEELEVCEALHAHAARTGSLAATAMAAYVRSWPLLAMGRLAEAEADLELVEEAVAAGWTTYRPAVLFTRAHLMVERDLPAETDASTAGIELDPAWPSFMYAPLFAARGRALLELDRPEEAIEAARRGLELRGGVRVWLADEYEAVLGEALARLGRREEAVDIAAAEVAVAESWGAPRARGAALRLAGIATGGAEGVPALQESVAILRRSPSALHLVRSLVDLGAAQRRLGRRTAAVEHLREALDRAGRLGMRRLERHAREELAAAGLRPRRTALTGAEALTPSERRVCDLAAEGLTNRQIAERLFVTVKAVEKHLANAYPKLGITSRRELAAALGDPAGA